MLSNAKTDTSVTTTHSIFPQSASSLRRSSISRSPKSLQFSIACGIILGLTWLYLALQFDSIFIAPSLDLVTSLDTITSALTSNASTSATHTEDAKSSEQEPDKGPWRFEVARDRNNQSLDDAQCSIAFPNLYLEIDRAAAFWRERSVGSITPDHIDLAWSTQGGLRCMIHDQELYIIESRGLNHFKHWKERSHATLLQIHRAIISSPNPIPNIEFSIKVDDIISLTEEQTSSTLWVFSRNLQKEVEKQVWIMPDFNFWAYPGIAPSFNHFQSEAMDVSQDFDSKESKLVWRGTTDYNTEIRSALIEQSSGRSWSEVHKVDEDADDAEAIKYRISLADHCRYKFAAHTEGTTWSGRLKYLLSCNSVVLIHPLTFTTHLYHLLKQSGPDQNYQPVKRDYSDLDEVMSGLLSNPEKTRRIADNAAATFRDQYVTAAAQVCYWRRLFLTWSEVAFEPDPFEYETLHDGTVLKTWRGMPFEEYLFHNANVGG